MKRRKRNVQILSVIMTMAMLLLSACGNAAEPAVAEVIADTPEVEATAEPEPEPEEVPTVEEGNAEEEEEEQAEEKEEEKEEKLIPYVEENELEFCTDTTVASEAVRVNINDESDMEVTEVEWELKGITIEDGEDGTKITIESEVRGNYWTDRKSRQMYRLVVPTTAFFDLNTGECYPDTNSSGDMELGYIATVEWNDVTYDVDIKSSTEWDDNVGEWSSSSDGGYVHPTVVHHTDTIIIPEGYDGLGMFLTPITFEYVERRNVGVTEEKRLINDAIEESGGGYVYSIMDMHEMLNTDTKDTSDDKESTTSNTTSAKPSAGNTTANNGSTPSTNNGSTTTTKQEEKQQNTHTHSYTSSVTKNPTCIENGVKTFTCSCGDSYVEEIPRGNHQYVAISEQVYHPSTGHYESVTRKEVWCGCGFRSTSNSELIAHQETCTTGNSCGVDEWTDNVWVVDQPEYWSEETFYQCSVCGARQ